MQNRKGFTLIELLIVIVIASMLLSLSAFGANKARQSARDDKRLADMEAIRSGLARYKADCGTFPNALPAAGDPLTSASNINCLNNNTYIEMFPSDPESPSVNYSYKALPAAGTIKNEYILCASLTEPPSPLPNVTDCDSCGAKACNVIYTN